MPQDVPPPFGAHAPRGLCKLLFELNRRAPRNRLGQHLAQPIRKLFSLLSPAPVDVEVEGVRLRCHFLDNNCERKFAFMPWRFDVAERTILSRALGRSGTFVDIGANVGLYTLALAAGLAASGRVIAVEPNPTAFSRLRFNCEATQEARPDGARIDLLQVGVGPAGPAWLAHDAANLGGSRVTTQAPPAAAIRVECKPLAQILAEQGVERADAIKIDIEGSEDQALVPYLDDTEDARLASVIVLENSDAHWRLDLRGALERRGYECRYRSRLNSAYARPSG